MMREKKAGFRSPPEVFLSGIHMILSRVLILRISAGVVYSNVSGSIRVIFFNPTLPQVAATPDNNSLLCRNRHERVFTPER